MSKKIKVQIIDGVEGPCLAINSTRVCGPKPWGGGTIIHSFDVDEDRLHAALPERRRLRAGSEGKGVAA